MVKFGRYEEFNSGKINLIIPAFEDEQKILNGSEFELELIVTAKQAKQIQDIRKTYDVLIEIMATSYPNMAPAIREAFIIRHSDAMYKQFLIWSGVPKEKIEELEELQKSLIKDYLAATPEERKAFLKDKLNDNAD